MSGDQLLSLEEAMKELQIDKDQLKELLKQNSLRYTLDQGQIKIPRMALMAIKLEKMTSSTHQFTQVKRTKRRQDTNRAEINETVEIPLPPSEKLMSWEEAMKALQVDRENLQQLILARKLRSITVEQESKIPENAILAYQILHQAAYQEKRYPQRNKSLVRRVY